MSGISTHVLDTNLGRPAAGLRVRLEELSAGVFVEITTQATDENGRCKELLAVEHIKHTSYRLIFEVGDYFRSLGIASLYPEIAVMFTITAVGTGHHMPLLLAANGYTTYRGS